MGIYKVIGNGKRLLFDIKFSQLQYLFDFGPPKRVLILGWALIKFSPF